MEKWTLNAENENEWSILATWKNHWCHRGTSHQLGVFCRGGGNVKLTWFVSFDLKSAHAPRKREIRRTLVNFHLLHSMKTKALKWYSEKRIKRVLKIYSYRRLLAFSFLQTKANNVTFLSGTGKGWGLSTLCKKYEKLERVK